MEAQHQINITLWAGSEKELSDKSKALQIIASNLDRDSLVIIANKSAKKGINQTIKTYQYAL
jgi:hypothetical protein